MTRRRVDIRINGWRVPGWLHSVSDEGVLSFNLAGRTLLRLVSLLPGCRSITASYDAAQP